MIRDQVAWVRGWAVFTAAVVVVVSCSPPGRTVPLDQRRQVVLAALELFPWDSVCAGCGGCSQVRVDTVVLALPVWSYRYPDRLDTAFAFSPTTVRSATRGRQVAELTGARRTLGSDTVTAVLAVTVPVESEPRVSRALVAAHVWLPNNGVVYVHLQMVSDRSRWRVESVRFAAS